jgi:glycosyltransferase involved in cell wall biosynthesis
MYALFNLKLLLRLLSIRPGIVCANDADTLPAAWLYTRLFTHTRLVWDAHEYFSQVPELNKKPFVRSIWQWIEKYMGRKAHLAYTVAPLLAQHMAQKVERTFHVIRNVPEAPTAGEASSYSPVPGRIVYTGAINVGRGIECLVASLAYLPPPFHLVICGQGDLSDQIQAQANNFEGRVLLTGMLTPTALKQEVAQAWLGYSALEHIGDSYYYSLANKFFDYAQAGLPQLCPNFPEYRSLIGVYPCAIEFSLAQPEPAKALALIIQSLAADSDRYQRMSIAAYEMAAANTWEKESEKLLELYHSF